MFKRLFKHKAQTTLEYVILISVVVAALIGMQVYLKRGISGKLKESVDSAGQQFSPDSSTYHYDTISETNSTETVADGITTTTINNQATSRTGSENIGNYSSELWWRN
jgi:uncharacterized protein (UPF0333 family)